MNVKVIYRMAYDYHPFNEKLREDGIKAWVLWRETTYGGTRMDSVPVAMFDRDSEGTMFQRFLDSQGKVVIDPECEQLFASERVLDARRISPEEERLAVEDNKKRGLR